MLWCWERAADALGTEVSAGISWKIQEIPLDERSSFGGGEAVAHELQNSTSPPFLTGSKMHFLCVVYLRIKMCSLNEKKQTESSESVEFLVFF